MRAIVIPFVLAAVVAGSAGNGASARPGGAKPDAVTTGRQIYERHCVACHGSGPGMPPFPDLPGTGALEVKYKGEKPALLSERTDLTPEVVAYFVRNGVSVMAPYRKTELSDTEVAQIGAYLSRNNPDLKKKRK